MPVLNSYIEVRDWLEGFIPLVYGKQELGLERVENLLSKLGNPEKKFKAIHVGGTSGKGSTCFYISELLTTKGYKVGLHISPHLVDLRERMQINGKLITLERFIALSNKIKGVVEAIAAEEPHLTPSYFEILVAMSLLFFAEEKVDWAVVEVGLGGRLDGTNVLASKVSVITNVGLDHTEILGSTVEKIAEEKAGIIKEKTILVTGAEGKALDVIEKLAKSRKAPLITISTQGDLEGEESDVFGSVSKQYYQLRSSDKSFASRNFNMAMLAVLAAGINLDKKTVEKVSPSGFAGRFEQIDETVIVDGAHNEEKVKSITQLVSSQFPEAKLNLVVAFKSGKNWQKMLEYLVKNLPISIIVATEYQGVTDMGKGSAVKAAEISDFASKIHKSGVKTISNSQLAVFDAISNLHRNEIVLVTGSLYLVGEARTMWQLPEF